MPMGDSRTAKITKMFTFEGINRKEVNVLNTGDIAIIAGIPDVYIGETICDNINTRTASFYRYRRTDNFFKLSRERFAFCRTRREVRDK
jgi:translation elongation factor EF-G